VSLNVNCVETKSLTDLLRSFGLYWTNLRPTRVNNCLYSIVTNCNLWDQATEVSRAVINCRPSACGYGSSLQIGEL
jgi:hypothetical protein